MESKRTKIILSIILSIYLLAIGFKICYNTFWDKKPECKEEVPITQCYYTTKCINGLSTIGPCRMQEVLVCNDMTICLDK